MVESHSSGETAGEPQPNKHIQENNTLDTELQFKSIKELPPLVRGSRGASAAALALQEQVASQKPVKIVGDFDEKQITSITQRIRTAAKKVGLDVTIRTTDGLSFRGYVKETTETE